MSLSTEHKGQIIKFCKDFIEKNGSVRVGWAIEKVIANGYKAPTHEKEKFANTIIQTGEYTKEKAAKSYDDWNIYKNPDYSVNEKNFRFNKRATIVNIIVGLLNALLLGWQIYKMK